MAVLKTPSILAEKGICHMTRDTITALPDPNGFSADPFTDLIRSGARQLIEQALEAELAALLAQFPNETTPAGHAHIVRHGQLPEREVMTGIGPVPVKVPRVRDRGQQAEKVRFTSSILPPYLHKAKSVEELLPWLYLKGISTGDFCPSSYKVGHRSNELKVRCADLVNFRCGMRRCLLPIRQTEKVDFCVLSWDFTSAPHFLTRIASAGNVCCTGD